MNKILLLCVVIQSCYTPSHEISQKAVKSAEAPQTAGAVFLDREGHRLHFTCQEGMWEATVAEQIGGFSRAEVLPVICEGHGDVGQFLSDLQHRSDEYVQRHVCVVRTRAGEAFSKFVYLGRQGLQGGAPSVYGLTTHTHGAHNRKIEAARPCPYLGRQRFIKKATNMTCFCDPANQRNRVELAQSSLNIGTGDFIELVSGDVFVDKTLLIKDLLTGVGIKALLITRPRRWGKTLNMSMLYNFLRCEVRENETTCELETINPHPGLFDNLNIGKEYPELIVSHQGKWPVISLNLKGVVGGDIQTIEQKFKDTFAALYKKHVYLIDWLNSPEKRENFIAEAEYFSDVRRGEANLAMLQKSLYFLSELLYEYHGQRVFVLLDEYDAPLNNTFLQPALYEQVLIFMRGLLGDCFKDNLYLEKGIMTGILRIAKADLFSGINNFKEYSLLDKRYAEHFGFTDAEVNHLFEQPHVRELIEVPAPDPEDIKAWYNGYTIGGITIYNPWSIMSCISEGGTLAPYWVSTGSDTLLRNLLKDSGDLVQQVEQLLTEDTIEVKISPYINMLDMDRNLKFWSLMLSAGYVTLAGEIPKQSSIKLFCQVRIPNMEIRATYEDLIMGWFEDQIGTSYYTDMMESLFRGEVELFSEILNRYLAEATSLRNVGPRGAEKFYSGFMGGLFISMRKDFSINSEVESGQGYTDMLVIPREKSSKTAVIFEYKVAKDQEALAGKVQEALDQIDDKEYVTRVQFYPHLEKIVKVGVAFCRKEAAVEMRNIELR